jgi:chromosome condensin MukBEF ATPase and DNA-binding subunit MukB
MRDGDTENHDPHCLARQLMETSIALEIVKNERDHLKTQLADAQFHLQHALTRADRMEHRLDATTRALTRLSESLISVPKQSSWVEIAYQGRPVLRLENPVGIAGMPQSLTFG